MYRYLVSLYIFIFSMFFFPLYKYGDLISYNRIYEGVENMSLLQAWLYYTFNINTTECIHFILIWFASRFIDRGVFIALSNAVLANVILYYLEKHKVNKLVSISFVVSNFYMLVIYFPAERLKYGVLFFFVSLLFIDKIKKFTFFMLISLLSHVQLGVLYLAMSIEVFLDHISDFLKTGKMKKWVLFVTPVLGFLLLFIWKHINGKLALYLIDSGITDLLRMFVIFIFSLLYSKDRVKTFIIFSPLLVATFLIGGDRLNMMGYFLFLYYGFQVRGGLNIGVIITSLYFFYKSVDFVLKVVYLGNAF